MYVARRAFSAHAAHGAPASLAARAPSPAEGGAGPGAGAPWAGSAAALASRTAMRRWASGRPDIARASPPSGPGVAVYTSSSSSSSRKKRDVKPHGGPWGPQSRLLLCRRRRGRSIYIYIYLWKSRNIHQQKSTNYRKTYGPKIVIISSRTPPARL